MRECRKGRFILAGRESEGERGRVGTVLRCDGVFSHGVLRERDRGSVRGKW